MQPTTLLRRLASLVTAGTALGLTLCLAPPALAAPAITGWVDENRVYKIDNVVTGGHLVPEGWGSNSSENIPIYASPLDTANLWRFQFPRDQGGWLTYQIKNVTTNRCIKPGPLGPLNRTLVVQVACNTSDSSQYWAVDRSPANPNEVQFINHSSGQAFRPWFDTNDNWYVYLTNPGPRSAYWTLYAA